ncbi:protein FAR1-RELATED SEQUENCE 5-like [Aegilops tauschii subsp. strangulata]|uniref:protein FAR1-RELATED SEQUENCE 5-like n=1 Tax=Aegilops tauschii subsp. strangulata TaxID=200361 RepID=UPI003CC8B925
MDFRTPPPRSIVTARRLSSAHDGQGATYGEQRAQGSISAAEAASVNFAPYERHGLPCGSFPSSPTNCSQGGLSADGKRLAELLARQDERRMKKLRSSQQQVHNPKPTPDLPDYLIPRLKMRFQDVEKAREFYNRYARHAGFGIRKTGGNDNHKYFVCSFQGIHTSSVSEANRKRNKTSQRTGCNARMRVKVQEDNTCVAVDIEYNHNHKLMQTDDMLVFLHTHKNYDRTILEYVKLLQYHDVKHTTIVSMLSENEDGSYFLSMTGRDLLNQKAMNARKDDLDDVLKLVSFFKDMKAINDEFFYDIQVDKDKSIKNIFWSNASCRGAYQDFGNYVTFDTTYKTNRFHMPLGVFVGTNHHLQSTIFAVALIRDEDAKSFKWLFDTFVRCMKNKHPTCILTVQPLLAQKSN